MVPITLERYDFYLFLHNWNYDYENDAMSCIRYSQNADELYVVAASNPVYMDLYKTHLKHHLSEITSEQADKQRAKLLLIPELPTTRRYNK
jgi:hypothetical protein